MRRVIEDLVENRKKLQEKVQTDLQELGEILENRSFFRRRKGEIKQKLADFNQDLNQLITGQDREWDAYNNNHSTTVFKSLEWLIAKLKADYSNVKTLLINFITLESSLQRLIDSIENNSQEIEGKSPKEQVEQLKEIKEQISPYQYSDFELRFRGEEDKIKEKLQQYLPLFSNALDAPVLDIGCGRGEFIELLQGSGIKAQGIDISGSMLEQAKAKGLDCRKGDALAFLKEQPDRSLGGIFAAQVIEHLSPGYLRDLVGEAFRVLQKGAPIVLETVNPLSIFALSIIYFLDVTHQKPLHPEYMRFLVESCGFGEVKIIYSGSLDEEKLMEVSPDTPAAREFNTNVDKLNHLLFDSPVYAVTGIKNS